jgi:apolipoprotein D and lipocalin family protein
MKNGLYALCALVLTACTGKPEGVEPVSPFVLERYLGEWYEIARLDHRFEKGLSEVTAKYTMRDDGGVRVINRGFNTKENSWEEAEGKAYFIDDTNTGALKVSFFGPFYGSYNIARLNADYSMALVIGPSLKYAWILSRDKTPEQTNCKDFTQTAKDLGIELEQWIWIQTCS